MPTENFDLEAYTALVASFTRAEKLLENIYYRFRLLRETLKAQGLLPDGYSLNAGSEVRFMATYFDLDEMSIDLSDSSDDTLCIHATTYRFGGDTDSFFLSLEFLTLSLEDQLKDLICRIREGQDITAKYDLAAREREVTLLEARLAHAKAAL